MLQRRSAIEPGEADPNPAWGLASRKAERDWEEARPRQLELAATRDRDQNRCGELRGAESRGKATLRGRAPKRPPRTLYQALNSEMAAHRPR